MYTSRGCAQDAGLSAALEACVSAKAWEGDERLELDLGSPEHRVLDQVASGEGPAQTKAKPIVFST